MPLFLISILVTSINANRILLQTTQDLIGHPRYCITASDCQVKNVGNCCGYYPGCVNINYTPDLEAVKQQCEADGLSSICGWTDPSSCSCNENNQCVEVYSSQCNLAADTGPCEAQFIRYFYNNETDTCTEFTYGGCGGNENNFETNETCLAFAAQCRTDIAIICGGFDHCVSYWNGCNTCTCDGLLTSCTEMACVEYGEAECKQCADGYTLNDGQCASSDCTLIADGGECDANMKRYFYNSESEQCEIFWYGGCGGNGNNFETEIECVNECANAVESDIDCTLTYETGPCKAAFPRYYYNSQTGLCETFTYGGCEGNSNNFKTNPECVTECEMVSRNNAIGLYTKLWIAITLFIIAKCL